MKGGKTLSHQQILEKAIKLAIKGGWYSFASDLFGKITLADILLRHNPNGQGLEWTVKGHESDWSLIEALIYSHDFAKALWGEEINHEVNGDDRLFKAPIWQYHLQQMVIAPDPIAYLGNNI